MEKYRFKKGRLSITGSKSFADASAEELRVLVALMETDCSVDSVEELAEIASVSRARAAAAIALFEDDGVIIPEDGEPSVSLEFGEPIGKAESKSAKSLAKDIRDEGLSELIKECTALMKQGSLPHEEARMLTELCTEDGLSEEYVATLAAYLSSKGKLTVGYLTDRAQTLKKRGIDSLEMLEVYIKDKENEDASEWELRRFLKIYNRPLSEDEKLYAKKWFSELGYSVGILEKAYNITINAKGRMIYSYMNTIVESWHKAGCRTVEDCESRIEADKLLRAQEREQKKTAVRKREKPEPPRYGNFDIEEAFEKALKRSYGSDSDN